MKKWKIVKSKLKNDNKWNKYKEVFRHKQMQLAITKICLVFDEKIDIDKLFLIEESLIDKTNDRFSDAFKEVSILLNNKADWNSFAKFMNLQVQMSTYYKDMKQGKDNIFINNVIKMNEEKRKYFLQWLHSIDQKDNTFNDKIIKVQKIVF